MSDVYNNILIIYFKLSFIGNNVLYTTINSYVVIQSLRNINDLNNYNIQ